MTRETRDVSTIAPSGGLPARVERPESPFVSGQERATDFVPPELRLLHPQSEAVGKDGKRPGIWYCRQTDEEFPTLEVVCLRLFLSRTYFVRGNLAAPVCSSLDSIMPRSGGQYPGPCAQCPMRAEILGFDAKEGACRPDYTLVVASRARPDSIYALRVRGTAAQAFSSLYTVAKMKYGLAFPTLSFVLATQTVQPRGYNAFLGASFLTLRPLPKAEAEAFVSRAMALAGGTILLPQDVEETAEAPAAAQAAAWKAQDDLLPF